VERLEPSHQWAEDTDTARVITQIQGGNQDAFAIVYMRYFDRVYSYLKVVLGDDAHAVEEAVQEVFVRVLAALPRYERREQPFRAWLFTIARNHVLSQLQKQGRVDPTDPSVLDSWREGEQDSGGLGSLDWITDRELLLFIERLPLLQRQVLVLRFLIGFGHREVAAILGRTESDVSVAQSRALRFLRERLTAVGRGPREARQRDQMRRPLVKARVARRRRTALLRYN
jgi:RNA polymerase sigma-70 factor (ECF subfamily)